MLTFITGQPGAGKTLFLISTVDALSRKTGRPVFYNKKLKPDDEDSPGQLILLDVKRLPWTPFEDGSGFDWFKAPEGAIIVLDESHRELFPMRMVGSDVPKHVDAMSTHRHRGHDVFITSQHSTQVDTFIRKMAGDHSHFIRRFGMAASSRFTWMEHQDEKNPFSREKADTGVFRFPKNYYGTYRSTVLDTVERKLPLKRLAVMGLGALSIPLLITYGISAIWPDDKEPEVPEGIEAALAAVHTVTYDRDIVDRPILYESATWEREVEDIPFSAKLYDQSVKIVSYPRVSGCSRITTTEGSDSCDCYSQQGNNLRLSYAVCLDYMKNGWFDFSKPDIEDDIEQNASNQGASGGSPTRINPMPATTASEAPGAAGS